MAYQWRTDLRLFCDIPKQDIAKMIGASREMVSRVMKDLQLGGYIEMRGSAIVLRDSIVLAD